MIELEQAGANLLATDQQGNTCLHLAARFGHKDIVKFLIEAAPSAILDMADHEKWDIKISVSVLKYEDKYCQSSRLLGSNLVTWNTAILTNTSRVLLLFCNKSFRDVPMYGACHKSNVLLHLIFY